MPCTTILVGKKASYDGSVMIARNDDSPSGRFTAKKFVVVHPDEQPKTYQSVISGIEIVLPEKAMRYCAMPNAVEKEEGIWAASGINEAHVAMTATETITSNTRVLGADPLVSQGIGEEDIVTLVLPYIHSAKEGVMRLGALLEKYGTYEMNGIAFMDINEIWWLETIGGHHWMARRVPDDAYVVMPNQLGIDKFDFADKDNFTCSNDLKEFVEKYHLDLSLDNHFCPRDAFGSHSDADHVYNTPRAWAMLRYFNPHDRIWDSKGVNCNPQSDDLPWCMIPEKKITIEDMKYVLSNHYQGTPYDPYMSYGDKSQAGVYRSIGINRNDFLSIIQLKPGFEPIEWIAFASNVFNGLVPFYGDIETTPDYLSNTTKDVSTDNFYWASRLLAAMGDASYKQSLSHIERYQERVMAKGHAYLHQYNELLSHENDDKKRMTLKHQANEEIANMIKQETTDTLNKVLYELSNNMKNAYSRSDS